MKKRHVDYNLKRPPEIPIMGLKICTWTSSCARLPEHGQRVVFMNLRGTQLHGTYQGDNQWDADATEDRAAHRAQYTPSVWKPE